MRAVQENEQVVASAAPAPAPLQKLDAQAIAAYLLDFTTIGQAHHVAPQPTVEYLVAGELARSINGGIIYNLSLTTISQVTPDVLAAANAVHITVTGIQAIQTALHDVYA